MPEKSNEISKRLRVLGSSRVLSLAQREEIEIEKKGGERKKEKREYGGKR
jgi:hypothetical protein